MARARHLRHLVRRLDNHTDPVYRQVAGQLGGRMGLRPDMVDDFVAALPGEFLPPPGTPTQWANDLDSYGAATTIAAKLGWTLPLGGSVHLQALTVATATALQLDPIVSLRRQRHVTFVAQSMGVPAPGVPPARAVDQLGAALRGAWRLRWSNHVKETFWRLVVNGLPTSERMGRLGDPCPCGAPSPGREHHLWSCPAAAAVVGELTRCLPAQSPPVRRHHVWLMDPPYAALQPDVWRVVCLAAIRAMWVARGFLMVPARRERFPAGGNKVQHAQQLAVNAFWRFLREFTMLGKFPMAWRRLLGPASPFLCFPHPAGKLTINCPQPA